MPDRPLQIAAYAAGASLAAVTLVYVFGPTYFLDDEAAQSTKSSRKRGIVGLSNPANDCFINSVLQTLAGLPELRVYLIRELHLRRLEGKGVYDVVLGEGDEGGEEDGGEGSEDPVAPFREKGERMAEWKVRGLQMGLVTSGLKDMLDALNERPIYKKTLSAQGFVGALEQAFRTRINRSQQDAQEFLQLVTERLAEEFYAGMKARKRARAGRRRRRLAEEGEGGVKSAARKSLDVQEEKDVEKNKDLDESHPSFPFEGKIESQIECTHCQFKPRPSTSSFVTLTLHVPQGGNATSLSTCFDGMLKVEHIDDFKCAKCRMTHALETKMTLLANASSKPTLEAESQKVQLKREIELLKQCIDEDPETPPKDISLPPVADAPKRKIARHSRIASFPRVLAIHLSRSMWDNTTSSAKNLAKVSFPETLPLGGLLEQVSYRLLGVVTHKGGHNSGHYESFRRQILKEPYLAPVSMGERGLYSNYGTPRESAVGSPALKARGSKDPISRELGSVNEDEEGKSSPDAASTLSPIGPSESTSSVTSAGRSSRSGVTEETGASSPTTSSTTMGTGTRASVEMKDKEGKEGKVDLRRKSSMTRVAERFKGTREGSKKAKKKNSSRWWRISDDKIKECTTRDVLKQEREVYLLFYEIMEPGESECM
ncbi:hypothetical protein CAC42_7170 [Sphaceloma murrayae]|uniref:Ubiquitin carboxyl-terminal hydrolase n=1 Tax=Sphaceloma murrayae TaxID=2082308 RepID=A0A2K1QPU7_9PEZI|nr:hypothetical protein CAC42_7170 [Sphaceloma murrayae]